MLEDLLVSVGVGILSKLVCRVSCDILEAIGKVHGFCLVVTPKDAQRHETQPILKLSL